MFNFPDNEEQALRHRLGEAAGQALMDLIAPGDVLGISGLGSGAVGYYKDGDKRWRVVSLGRSDDDAAGDVLDCIDMLKRDAVAQRLSERLAARTPAPGGPATPPPV